MELKDFMKALARWHVTEEVEGFQFASKKADVLKDIPRLCDIETQERKDWSRVMEDGIVCFRRDLIGIIESYCFGGPLFTPSWEWQNKQSSLVAFFHVTDCVERWVGPPQYITAKKATVTNPVAFRMNVTHFLQIGLRQWRHYREPQTIEEQFPRFRNITLTQADLSSFQKDSTSGPSS